MSSNQQLDPASILFRDVSQTLDSQWDIDTIQACTRAILEPSSPITGINGFVICYNVAALNTVSGYFASDVRLYGTSSIALPGDSTVSISIDYGKLATLRIYNETSSRSLVTRRGLLDIVAAPLGSVISQIGLAVEPLTKLVQPSILSSLAQGPVKAEQSTTTSTKEVAYKESEAVVAIAEVSAKVNVPTNSGAQESKALVVQTRQNPIPTPAPAAAGKTPSVAQPDASLQRITAAPLNAYNTGTPPAILAGERSLRVPPPSLQADLVNEDTQSVAVNHAASDFRYIGNGNRDLLLAHPPLLSQQFESKDPALEGREPNASINTDNQSLSSVDDGLSQRQVQSSIRQPDLTLDVRLPIADSSAIPRSESEQQTQALPGIEQDDDAATQDSVLLLPNLDFSSFRQQSSRRKRTPMSTTAMIGKISTRVSQVSIGQEIEKLQFVGRLNVEVANSDPRDMGPAGSLLPNFRLVVTSTDGSESSFDMNTATISYLVGVKGGNVPVGTVVIPGRVLLGADQSVDRIGLYIVVIYVLTFAIVMIGGMLTRWSMRREHRTRIGRRR